MSTHLPGFQSFFSFFALFCIGQMTETLTNGYSYESTQRELSNEYQQDRVYMVFKGLCVLVLWTKVASALEGLSKI